MDFDKAKSEIVGPAGLAMPIFNDDYSLDLDNYEQSIRFMIDGGVKTGRGYVIAPSGTGEALHLTIAEHKTLVEATVKAANNECPVVAGVASCNLIDAIEMVRNARDVGAGHVMIPPPYYYRLDHDSFVEWVRAIAAAVPDIAIMLYDQPWRGEGSGKTIDYQLLEAVSEEFPSVVSLKFGGPAVYIPMITMIPAFCDRFAFIDNSLGFCSTVGHIHGSRSFIAGPVLWWPKFELHYWDLLEAGKYAEAERWHARLAPYMHFFMGEEFTTGETYDYYFGASVIKASLEYVGLKGGPVRQPFQEMSEEAKSALFKCLDEIGFDGRKV